MILWLMMKIGILLPIINPSQERFDYFVGSQPICLY